MLRYGLPAVVNLAAERLGLAKPPIELKVGDPAPAFSAPGSDGSIHRIGDRNAGRVSVVAWFPKAFTSG